MNLNPFSKKHTQRTQQAEPVEVKAKADEIFARFDLRAPAFGLSLSTHDLYRYYKTVAPLATATNMLVRAVASTPIKMVSIKDDTRVKDHPLLQLLAHPNSDFQKTMTSLFASITFWRALSGDAFLVMTGKGRPLELYVLQSRNMDVYLTGNGYIDRYEYQTANGKRAIYRRDPVSGKFLSEDGLQELIHLSGLISDPDTADQGAVSDAAALKREIDIYVSACEHNLSLLANGGRPAGALVVPPEAGKLDDKARQEIKNQLQASLEGSSNAGRTLLLEGGLEWKNFATNPKDGDFNATKDSAEAQIFKALGVPMDLAGNSKAVSANNMVNIRREFYHSRVVPQMSEILEFFNNTILPRFDRSGNFQLQVDVENIDVFTEERAARRQIIEGSLTMTINEKRKELGLPPIEGGDKITDPNGRPIAGPDAGQIVGTVATPANPV